VVRIGDGFALVLGDDHEQAQGERVGVGHVAAGEVHPRVAQVHDEAGVPAQVVELGNKQDAAGALGLVDGGQRSRLPLSTSKNSGSRWAASATKAATAARRASRPRPDNPRCLGSFVGSYLINGQRIFSVQHGRSTPAATTVQLYGHFLMIRKLLVGFDDVFESQVPATLEQILTRVLSGVSRRWLLQGVTQLLGYVNQVPAVERTHTLDMQHIFGSQGLWQKPQALDYYEQVTNFGISHGKRELSVLHPKPLLQLFQLGFQRADEPHTVSDQEWECQLFLACMLMNTPYINQQSAATKAAKQLMPAASLARFMLPSMFADFELINQRSAQILSAQLLKSVRFFEFMESEPRFVPLLQAFLRHHGCTDWQDYNRGLSGVVKPVIYDNEPGRINLNVLAGDNFEADRAFLNRFALTPGQALDEEDFTSLRTTPLYEEEPGRFVLIYPVLAVEALHKGLYFQFNLLNDALPDGERISNWRSVYCDFYSEQYLLNNLLDISFQGRGVALSGTVIKPHLKHKGQGEPDYYFRDGHRAILFESKDVIVPKGARTGSDFFAYFEEVKKRFHYDVNEKGKEVGKATRQLVRNVARLLNHEIPLDTDYDRAELVIYPVLVLHDRLYNVPGLNVLVNDWFQQDLAASASEDLPVHNVRPLVIVDVDTVMAYHEAFRDQVLVFEEVLEEYYHYLSPDHSKAGSQAAREQLAIQATLPFALFLENYAGERGLSPVPMEALYALLPKMNKGAAPAVEPLAEE
jgi:hypothetical protein